MTRQEVDRRTKPETPPAAAEQRALARAQTAPGARADTSQAPAAPRLPTSPNVASSSFVPSDVLGQLAVSDRESALRKVRELITRLGAVENRRIDGPDGPILELTIQRDVYAEFTRELGRLGRWQPTREPSALPAHIRVVLQITG